MSPRSPVSAGVRPLGLDAVTLDPGGLLGGWQERNAAATVPHCIEQLDRAGALDNLRRSRGSESAASDARGLRAEVERPESSAEQAHVGMWFSDSDVYKTLEAACWQLGRQPGDPTLLAFVDATARLLAEVQDADGYLNSYFQFDQPRRRWQDMRDGHEMYCAGHLLQAAVAAARAGVGSQLIAVAVRFADLLVARFGDGVDAVCGHPVVETALVELYRVTGKRQYLELAGRLVGLRGRGLLGTGGFGPAYYLDHAPVRDAPEFTGHAVRQVYLLAGVVDVATETGDAQLLSAAERLWESAYRTKTYLTGAHGSRHRDEAVGDAYELPPDRAYAESCAAVGSFQWNWRMLLATGKHRYADEMERVLYNGIAASTGLDGRHFFYSNPLHLRTGHHDGSDPAPSQRRPWYPCACCPPNLARLMASLHCHVATADESGMQIHLYATGTIHTGLATVRVETDYPWDGRVDLIVESASSHPWTLALRVPGWCPSAGVRVNGRDVAQSPTAGYLRLNRAWERTTRVALVLPMPVRTVAAHHRADAIRDCVALVRGPVVFCVEQADLPAGTVLEDVAVNADAPVDTVVHPRGSAIPVTLRAQGAQRHSADGALYRDYAPGADRTSPLVVQAVPYFLWGNRETGPMRVWLPALPEDPVNHLSERTY